MPIQAFKESFTGKYDGIIPATLLKPGWVTGGLNMRKISRLGGWKVRKGCTLHNTTAAEGGSSIDSLHYYKNPRSEDYHFLAQCNSKLLDASTDPPTAGTVFGTDLGPAIGTTPGFSCVVKEDLFYADGSGRPLTWGGDTPYCSGFLVYDNSEGDYLDFTRVVTDGRDTTAILLKAANDVFYVCSNEIAEAITLDLTAYNGQTATATVYSWVSGAWEERSTGWSDGTSSGGKTLAQDGTMSWTRNATDSMKVIGGIMGYWYKVVTNIPVYGSGTEEDCSDISDWVDGDAGDGASTQVTYDSRSCFKFDSGSGAGNSAKRTRDFGTMGDQFSVEAVCYHDALGTQANADYFVLKAREADVQLQVLFCTDGLFIYDGSSWNEVGTDIVSTGSWITWRFVVDCTTPASATVDVYKNNVLQEASVDCSQTGSWTDGEIDLLQNGETTANRITYVDSVTVTVEASQTPVEIQKCTVVRDMNSLTNKWSGVYQWVSGCRFYDASDTEFDECLGKISNESTSQYMDIDTATTGDFVYIKTLEPACGFGFGVVNDYSNSEDAQVDSIECWDGDAWKSCPSLEDTTLDDAGDSSFSQTGSIFFDATVVTPRRRTLEGDKQAGYWYRVSWDATLSASTRIFLVMYAPYPETLTTYDGCVEFKGRLFLWGDPEYPNRMRYSAVDRPDCFSGSDSGYTDPFGDMKKVLCAIPFYNELIVFKEDSIFLLEGYSPATFGTLKIADTVGLASPKTAHVVEVGYPGMHSDEPLSIAIWQDVDGIYVLDGRKPRKVSLPIDNYFNIEYSDAIAATNIRNRQAFIDPLNNEYHLLLPSGELVYNYVSDEWYPPWEREIDLKTGLVFKGTDNRYYTYGGSATGFVMRLENDTTDKNSSNTDVIISHSIKTRAISAEQERPTSYRFTARKVWAELAARSAGSITTKSFRNMATSGTTEAIPQAMSMVNSGFGVANPLLDLSIEDCSCFQLEFSLATADQEMEIRGFTYELEVRGEVRN